MTALVADAGLLLERADAARGSGLAASPVELWRLAALEAQKPTLRIRAGRNLRCRLFRHAMIHAGYLDDPASGKPYARCPVCEAALG